MFRERRRTKSAAAVAHDPGHDDDAPAGRSGGQGQRRPPSAAEGRASCGPAASPERRASVARFLRGPHHLANEALRSLGALVAVTDAAGARIEVIVPRGHCWSALADHRDGARRIEIVGVSGESASRSGMARCRKSPIQPTPCAWPEAALLSCRPWSARKRPVSAHVAVVHLRGMSGSFAAWRISGEFETFREQGASILVADSYRGLASERACRAKYCRQHGLTTTTFGRWLNYLAGKEAARKQAEYQAELRRQQRREAQEKRRKGAPAFVLA